MLRTMEAGKQTDNSKYLSFVVEMCLKECDAAKDNLILINKQVLEISQNLLKSNDVLITSTNYDTQLINLTIISEILRNFNIKSLTHFATKMNNFVPQSGCVLIEKIQRNHRMNPFINDNDELTTFQSITFNNNDCLDHYVLSENLNENNSTNFSLSKSEITELFEEPLNTFNAMEAVMGYDPKDDEKLCRFYDPNTNGCFKGNNCKKEHSSKISEGWTKDREIVKISVLAEITFPAIGQKIILIPTYIQNVENFYAHLFTNQPPQSSLRSVILKMNSPEFSCKYKVLRRLPAEHELVFVLFKDDSWYRAKIISFIDENNYKVMFVDFGNIHLVNITCIREWYDHFDYLPFQAISCHLANIKKIKDYHVEAIDQLKKRILNKTIVATVVDNVNELSVLLTDDDGIDIGQLLYISNFGVLKKANSFKTKFIPA